MNNKLKGMVVILLAILVLGCTDSTEMEAVQPVTYKPEPTPTTTPVHTPEPATMGSYSNPATIDYTVVLSSYGDTFHVSILDVIRGEEADEGIYFSNEYFYEEAPSEYEYCLVEVEVKYIKGTESRLISGFDFTSWAADVELGSSGFSLLDLPPDCPELTQGKLMQGGTKNGWMLFTVPQNKEVIIAYTPGIFTDSGAYFTIGQ